MGRFAYSMNVSLDLRIEQVPGDNGAGEWLRITEEPHREFNALSVPRPTARSVWAARRSPRNCFVPSFSTSCGWTHPAILGFGRPLFDDYDVPIDLALVEQRSFEQGVTMHRYTIHEVSEASSC